MTTPQLEPLHFVTVVHERDAAGEVTSSELRFECRGTIDSECHLYADDVANFGLVPREQWTRHEDCWLKDWFDVGTEVAPYLDPDGDGEPISDLASIPEGFGPIEFEYDDAIFWSWVDGPNEMSEAARARRALDAAGYTGLDTEVITIVLDVAHKAAALLEAAAASYRRVGNPNGTGGVR